MNMRDLHMYDISFSWICIGTSIKKKSCRGRDCVVVGFITTYAIIVYHH